MYYSKEEKEAIHYFLVQLMKIDGRTAFSEVATLYEINQLLDISVNQANDSLNLTEQESKSIIAKMNVEKRLEILAILKRMAQADEHFDAEERSMIYSLFS